MKKYIIITFVLAAFGWGCTNKEEQARLQNKIDSLNLALTESKKAETVLSEVGVALDSIDASRHVLQTKIAEGIFYADYIQRLNAINTDIRNLNTKLTKLEVTLKGAQGMVHRLKNDLAAKAREIVSLQLDIANLRDQNKNLTANNISKDSIIASKNELIQVKDTHVAKLEEEVKNITDESQVKVANLYFAQAQALETAANRTKFAPRKKKETRREALELYKLSYSLGNKDAQPKIEQLEKELS